MGLVGCGGADDGGPGGEAVTPGGQQDRFDFSQATKVGGTIYAAGTAVIGEGMPIPESMAGVGG
jgi:hypothetical protein